MVWAHILSQGLRSTDRDPCALGNSLEASSKGGLSDTAKGLLEQLKMAVTLTSDVRRRFEARMEVLSRPTHTHDIPTSRTAEKTRRRPAI